MKNIIINGINYIVYDSLESVNISMLANIDVAYNDGTYCIPISLESSKSPCYKYLGLWYYQLQNKELIDDRYSSSNIVDFNNDASLSEYFDKCSDLRKKREMSLMTSQEKFTLPITGTEDPEKAILKMAINSKNINIHSYRNVIGKSFPNDLRELRNDSISMKKLRDLADALDLEVEITIRDKENAINPMGNGKEYSTIITKKGDNLC